MFDIPQSIRQMTELQLKQELDNISLAIHELKMAGTTNPECSNLIGSQRKRQEFVLAEMDKRRNNRIEYHVIQGREQ